ncbi:unnamed protein product [Nezara viridula]|uniref:Uncharacterized protein n=1 Tax=Nezara viridula TaxID=85310 RepID=A0A9P0MTL8_NEZVI|nr:unnamed protein product [Nezara viridula]
MKCIQSPPGSALTSAPRREPWRAWCQWRARASEPLLSASSREQLLFRSVLRYAVVWYDLDLASRTGLRNGNHLTTYRSASSLNAVKPLDLASNG